LPAIKREGANYSFYVIPDNKMNEDSSLLINWTNVDLNTYNFRAFARDEGKMISQPVIDLSKRILNQVGLTCPTGIGNKEFIENLAGNYIIVNNIDNTVQGSGINVFGYMGDSAVISNPVELTEPTDNGNTYEVPTWFSFSKTELFSITSNYFNFYSLLIKAGLIDAKNYKFNFINDGDYYTVFIPTNEALTNAQADTLSIEELTEFLQYHFVRDHMIFTDGKKAPGLYETARIDESSGEFSAKYSKISIIPGVDYIDILDSSGNLYYRVNEEDGKTNHLGITKTGDGTAYWDFITTSVVHEIDTVLIR
jgi:hypothetical protein